MKPRRRLSLILSCTAGLALVSASLTIAQTPLPSAFFYQGKLSDAGQPAAGLHEFEFALYAAETGGTALGTLTKEEVDVQNGVFQLPLDFGAAAFNGQARWLEIRVRRSDGPGFTTLTPRQSLLPAPHALYAARAGMASSVSDGAITQNKIAAGHVSNSALAIQAITSDKIADGTIEGYKMKSGTVGTPSSPTALSPGTPAQTFSWPSVKTMPAPSFHGSCSTEKPRKAFLWTLSRLKFKGMPACAATTGN